MTLCKIKMAGYFTVAGLTLSAAPAFAAPPEIPAVISALGLSGHQLSPSEMRSIRGGFDLGHALSINFAFRQTEAINGIIVKSIMVPETNVTAGHGGGIASPPVQVTDSAGAIQTVKPAANGVINLSAQGNNGLTVINTQLGAGGLMNTTANQANNADVNVAATMNIAISGMSQFLTQQQSFANARSGLYYTNSAFK